MPPTFEFIVFIVQSCGLLETNTNCTQVLMNSCACGCTPQGGTLSIPVKTVC